MKLLNGNCYLNPERNKVMTTKISYLRDPKAPQRVLTLVSRVNGDKVEYGFSMNRPTRWRKQQEDGSFRYEDLIKGDQFSKTRGRQIAEGRLAVEPMVADLAGRAPAVAIFETLRDASDNSLIRRIVGYHLDIQQLSDGVRWYRPKKWGSPPSGPDDPQRFGRSAYTGLYHSRHSGSNVAEPRVRPAGDDELAHAPQCSMSTT